MEFLNLVTSLFSVENSVGLRIKLLVGSSSNNFQRQVELRLIIVG